MTWSNIFRANTTYENQFCVHSAGGLSFYIPEAFSSCENLLTSLVTVHSVYMMCISYSHPHYYCSVVQQEEREMLRECLPVGRHHFRSQSSLSLCVYVWSLPGAALNYMYVRTLFDQTCVSSCLCPLFSNYEPHTLYENVWLYVCKIFAIMEVYMGVVWRVCHTYKCASLQGNYYLSYFLVDAPSLSF